MPDRKTTDKEDLVSVALITGASKGLGYALTHALADQGWSLVVDARGQEELERLSAELDPSRTQAIVGDVTDAGHRRQLVESAQRIGGPHLLVNNASYLGPSPQPLLRDYPHDELRRVFAVDVFAPLDLVQRSLPALLANRGVVVNVSSDAAVEAYPGWGGYGSAKRALDHLSAVLAAEEPELRVYAFDPGDMRTAMQQAAFPGEDISDRPEPATVVPAVLRLLEQRPASGRYRAVDLLSTAGAPG